MNLFFPSAPLDMEIREIAEVIIFLLQLAVEDGYAVFEEVQRHPYLLHRLYASPGLRHRLVLENLEFSSFVFSDEKRPVTAFSFRASLVRDNSAIFNIGYPPILYGMSCSNNSVCYTA